MEELTSITVVEWLNDFQSSPFSIGINRFSKEWSGNSINSW